MMRAAGLILLLTLGSCGYTTRSLLPGGAKRIAVDIFGNQTFYREIEFQLTREITTEFIHRSHYRVARRRDAEVVLSGEIIEVQRPTLIETQRDTVSEQAVIVTADVQLRRVSDDKLLMSFRQTNRSEFVVERGETLESAFDEALLDLAEDIVNNLERQSFVEELEKKRSEGSDDRD